MFFFFFSNYGCAQHEVVNLLLGISNPKVCDRLLQFCLQKVRSTVSEVTHERHPFHRYEALSVMEDLVGVQGKMAVILNTLMDRTWIYNAYLNLRQGLCFFSAASYRLRRFGKFCHRPRNTK